MKLSLVLPLLALALATAFGQEAMPRMTSVEPMSGKVGDVVAVAGENLDKDNVGKVFLIDAKNDLPCEVTAQTATEIKLKIPEKATGRMAFMIRTAGKEPKDIVQPVKITIE